MMNQEKIKRIVSGVFLFVFGFIDVILIIRLLLRVIGASTKSSFVRFWFNFSKGFIRPFDGTFNNLGTEGVIIEIDTIIAIAIYAIMALLIIRVVNGLFEDKSQDKIRSLIDTFFKLTEGILGLRFLFKLVGAHLSSFVTFLYTISAPVYEPFEGLLPSLKAGSVEFETSTFIAIIIFIILDVATDRILTEIFKEKESKAEGSTPPEPVVETVPQQSTPTAPTVNVNVPQQPQPVPQYQQPRNAQPINQQVNDSGNVEQPVQEDI